MQPMFLGTRQCLSSSSGSRCHSARSGGLRRLMGGAPPALMLRTPFGKQPENSQFRLVSWPLLALVSPLVTKSSVVKPASLERRLSLILGPLLPFLGSSLDLHKSSDFSPLPESGPHWLLSDGRAPWLSFPWLGQRALVDRAPGCYRPVGLHNCTPSPSPEPGEGQPRLLKQQQCPYCPPPPFNNKKSFYIQEI